MKLFPVIIVAALAAPSALAQTRSQVYGSSLVQQAMTVYVRGDMGMATYESDATGSKETKAASTLSLGGWAGENRTVGASISSSIADVSFSLNESRMKSAFHDVRLMARLGWLTPSVGVSLSEVDVVRPGDLNPDSFSLYGTGLNAGLGLQVPVYPAIVVYADALVSRPSNIHDKNGGDAKLKDRKEADAGVSFDITDRMVDLLVGYRLREYGLEANGRSLKERSQGAYAGLRLGLYF